MSYFVEEYHHTPWLYWFAAVFGIIGLSLSILSKRKSILFQRASEPLLSQLEDYLNDVDKILDVPDSAKEIDIFSFTYTITNNQIKIIKNAFPTYQFSNCIFKAYSDAENLYLAGLEGTYAFPLASITAIQTIKKRVRIMEWHKELPYNKGFYKQFHLSSDAYGCIHCNRYYIVELMHAEKSYGIYIPSYDISILEHLTRQKKELNRVAHEMGTEIAIPFMFLSFICLAAIPAYAITDCGFIDVVQQKVIDPILEVVE